MERTILNRTSRFLLLDANIVAGYYLPESLNSVRARGYIKNIVDGVRNGGAPEVVLFIPNFCISEVFSVFAKYVFATWDKQVKKNLSKRLKKTDYDRIKKHFQGDFKNGVLFNRVDLNTYHIFATNLISLVDANYQYYRNNMKRKINKKMMSAADHSIIGIGLQLSKIHGRDNFAICTADHRLANILKKATLVKSSTAKRLGLVETSKQLGLEYGKNIYPRVINLAKTTKNELVEFFGVWPLPIKPQIKKTLYNLSASDCRLLAQLRKNSGIGRDSLPYTDRFELICKEFERLKGQHISRHAAWKGIGRVEKAPKQTSKRAKRKK